MLEQTRQGPVREHAVKILLGHLRYGTQGKNDIAFCHPFIKQNIVPAKNLALAGNFNLVNTEELFNLIKVDPDSFQKQSDLAAMMEVIHHYLVEEVWLNLKCLLLSLRIQK
jgi:amidophosphoribosyltransferase